MRRIKVALVALLMLLGSCGASAAQREGYGLETARCIANERAIVDRAGTSEAEDREALEIERARCDAARAAVIGGAQ